MPVLSQVTTVGKILFCVIMSMVPAVAVGLYPLFSDVSYVLVARNTMIVACRFIIPLIVLLLVGLPYCCCAGAPVFYEQSLALSLDTSRHTLVGTSELDIDCQGESRVVLSLSARIHIDRVTVADKIADVTFSGEQLTVRIPSEMQQGRTRIAVTYRGTFNDPLPTQAGNGEDPTYGISGYIGSEGVFLGHGWYPDAGVPVPRFIVTVQAPAGILAVTAGKLIFHKTEQQSTVSRWEITTPLHDFPLAAGRYVIQQKTVGTIPISTYFKLENSALATSFLAASENYLTRYEKLFGPYPFEKFAIVENFFPSGYGFPSFTLLGSSVIRLPFITKTSLPHEIAHSWWGNGVLVDYHRGNWSEGLVTYLADYCEEELASEKAAVQYRTKLVNDFSALVTRQDDFPLREFRARHDSASRAIGYGKSAMVFHMVRKMIGDEAFFRALRALFLEKRFQQTSWDDFSRAFSRASGADVRAFMNQWLDHTGGPAISLESVHKFADKKGWIVSGRIRQSGQLFQFPLLVRLETAEGFRDKTVAVSGTDTPFSVISDTEPRGLRLDPDSDLFRIVPVEEIPPNVNRLKRSRGLIAIVAKEYPGDVQGIPFLLASLGLKESRIIPEDAVSPRDIQHNDLLIFGVPTDKSVLPLLPPSLHLSSKRFTFAGKEFSNPSEALFVVVNHPSDSARAVGIFHPLSPAAAGQSLRKITHYGGFGYLIFSAGENQGKGSLPVQSSATAVIFEQEGSR